MINMNLTSSFEDFERYKDANDIKSYYQSLGLDGIELMPFYPVDESFILPEMVNGVHMNCIANWIDMDTDALIRHYKRDLDYAKSVKASYVVFHIAQMTDMEALTLNFLRSDEEIIEKAAALINDLTSNGDYEFDFLMENLWYRGLTFLRPEIARYLIDEIKYPNIGFMLDTGHLLHMNLELKTQDEGIDFINDILDKNESVIPYIKGFHLQQSLTGEYVKKFLAAKKSYPKDPNEFQRMLFTHLFSVDKHQPFTTKRVNEIIRRVNPKHITLEYITTSREQHTQYIKEGLAALEP